MPPPRPEVAGGECNFLSRDQFQVGPRVREEQPSQYLGQSGVNENSISPNNRQALSGLTAKEAFMLLYPAVCVVIVYT